MCSLYKNTLKTRNSSTIHGPLVQDIASLEKGPGVIKMLILAVSSGNFHISSTGRVVRSPK